MSLSRDILITLIRSERGIDMLLKCLFLSTLSLKKVTLTIMSMSKLMTLSRMPWKYQESCILTQCSAKIVIRYLLDQGMYHTLTVREGRSQLSLRNRVTISDKKWEKQEKVKEREKSKKKWGKWGIGEEKWEKWGKKCSAVSPLLCSLPR